MAAVAGWRCTCLLGYVIEVGMSVSGDTEVERMCGMRADVLPLLGVVA